MLALVPIFLWLFFSSLGDLDFVEGLSLAEGVPSRGFLRTPRVLVTVSKTGGTVGLYLDASCKHSISDGAKVKDQEAPYSIVIPTHPLEKAGEYTFYAKYTHKTGEWERTTCSKSSVAYTLVGCPAGFIPVFGNRSLGTEDFCVMAFEAKRGREEVATSIPDEYPWTEISATDAYSACEEIHQENFDGRFALISNPEWMTIARDLEGIDANWLVDDIFPRRLFLGHTDPSSEPPLFVRDVSNPYSDTDNSMEDSVVGGGREQRRTFHLSSGNVIWDFSGNVWEWVDWSLEDEGFTLGPQDAWEDWHVYPHISGSLVAEDVLPKGDYTFINFTGMLYGGIGGAALRGGGIGSGPMGGAFTLSLEEPPHQEYEIAGFRCVYRPSNF